MAFVIESLGWVGAGLILAAYILVSLGRLGARSPMYQLINVLGSAGVLINSAYNGALPSAVLNVIWLGMGAYVLIRRHPGSEREP